MEKNIQLCADCDHPRSEHWTGVGCQGSMSRQLNRVDQICCGCPRFQKPTSTDPDAVYGYAVHCTFRIIGATGFQTESKIFRSKGDSETKARRVPIFKRGFVSIDRLEPFTRDEWVRVFGDGRRM